VSPNAFFPEIAATTCRDLAPVGALHFSSLCQRGEKHVDRLKLLVVLIVLLSARELLLLAGPQAPLTVDATQQLALPKRGRGPFPGSTTPGHSADFPIRLDLLIPTGELKPDGTVLIDFRITNIGNKPITLPISIRQRNLLPNQPDAEYTVDTLTLWLTGPGAIKEEYLAGYLGDPNSRLYKSESPETTAELYGRSDDPQSFYPLAQNQSLVVHASSRVGLKAGNHSLTAHAELLREFIGLDTGSPRSSTVRATSRVIGTADSKPQKKMLSTGKRTTQ